MRDRPSAIYLSANASLNEIGASMNAASDLYSQALSLPPAQREELAQLLFESLPYDDETTVEISEEFEQEIERRIAERAAGTAKCVDMETFIATIRAAANPPEMK
jgi:putative addiction module component (TIGR02574 family)